MKLKDKRMRRRLERAKQIVNINQNALDTPKLVWKTLFRKI